MFEEDFPPPGYRKATEGFLFWYLSLTLIFVSWCFGGAIGWMPAAMIALGMLAPVLIQIHKKLDLFESKHPMRRYMLALCPLWFSLGVAFFGSWETNLQSVTLDDRTFLALTESEPWMPLNTVPAASWTDILLSGSLYAMGLCILFVSASHYLFRKLLITLAANALVLCVVGFIIYLAGMERILGSFTPPHALFFSSFPHGEHWASFGLLWLIVLTGLIDHFFRRQRGGRFLERGGIVMLAATALLSVSIVLTGSSLHILLLAMFFAFVCLEIMTLRSRSARARKRGSAAAWGWGVLGLGILAGGIGYVLGLLAPLAGPPEDAGTASQSISSRLPAAEHAAIWRDSMDLIERQPWFGWGAGSYPVVMAFYQQADLGDAVYASAHSDLLQALVEHGVIGVAVWALPVGIVLLRWRKVTFKRIFSKYLWGAAGCALILGALSFPFQSPAFTLSFWIIVFSAFQWSHIATSVSPGQSMPNIVFSKREIKSARRKQAAQNDEALSG